MKLLDDYLKFSYLLGMLLGLTDFNDYEFRLKSGSVKRVFEDNKHYDVLLEYYDGTICYAKQMEDIDRKMKEIQEQQINSLPSEYDYY